MKRTLCVALFLTVTFYGLIATAAIDQQYVPPTSNVWGNVGSAGGVDQAQTFTVGTTGFLTGFDIWATRDQATTLPLLFDIRRTTGGTPTEPDSGLDILATGSLAAAQFGLTDLNDPSTPAVLTHVDLNAQSFSVVAGEVLAIVLRSDAPSPGPMLSAYSWRGLAEGQYGGGAAYGRTTGVWSLSQIPVPTRFVDRVFRTYVDAVPEPSSSCLLATAAASLSYMLRMRRSPRSGG